MSSNSSLVRAHLLALVLATVLATDPTHLAAQASKKGGVLTVALETEVVGFDAVKGGVLGISGEIVLRSLQEPLINASEKGEFTPRLATDWKSSEDGKTWTFKLRQGVKFHDGNELTAEDVADHYNRILDPANKSPSRTFITPIKGAKALDRHTVEFTLEHAWLPFLPVVATTGFIGPIPSKANVAAGKQQRHPVGTGPFVFQSWQSGDRIVVKRNSDYWNKDQVHLDEVVFRILPDTQTRYASLLSGQVDIIWTDRGATIHQGLKEKSVVSHVADGAGMEFTLLNTRQEHLKDQRVRAAIAHAYNQDAIINVSWENTRPAATHPFGPTINCGEAKYRKYDPKKAKELLAEYGKPVKTNIIVTATPRGREAGEIPQQMFKAVGIELEIQPVDQVTLVQRVLGRNYSMSGWRVADGLDLSPQIYALVHSKSSYNLGGFSTPELDAMADEMRTTSDRRRQHELLCKIMEVVNDQALFLYRGGGRHYAFSRPRVKDLPPNWRGFIDVTSVWLEQ
jgi:ABC-type transport system substrate-binding protein